MKNIYRMIVIGLGVSLICFGLIGIALSGRTETQKLENRVLVCQRAGTSVSSFALNLSVGDYIQGVSVWVHNDAEAFYSISDANKNQVVILRLATTDQPSEWKYSEGYFQIIDSGYYTFELFNATVSSVRSFTRLYQRGYVDEYLYPYQSFLWVGVFCLVAGVPLVVVVLASPLTSKPQN